MPTWIDTLFSGDYAESPMSASFQSVRYAASLLVLLCLFSCEDDASTITVGNKCTRNGDCAPGQFCVEGTCGPGQLVSCTFDEECPQDFKCLSDGTCSATA